MKNRKEKQGLWKTDTCFCFFEDKISVCDLRVTDGCYICLYENVKVGFLYIFSGGRRMKSAGLFKKAIALTMSTSMLLGSGG